MVVEAIATAAHDWHHFVIVEYGNALFDLERLDLVVNVLTTENSVGPQSSDDDKLVAGTFCRRR